MIIIQYFQSILKFFASLFTGFKENYVLRQKLNEAHKEIGKLERENHELEEKLKFKEEMFFENNALWIKKENGSKEGPFCSPCGQKNLTPINLHKENEYTWYCPLCKTPVHTKKHRKQGPEHIPGRKVH